MKTFLILLITVLSSIVDAGICNCRLPIFPKILNGKPTNHQIPWLVSIKQSNDYQNLDTICTGIVLKERWVLTTASCLHNQNIAALSVIAGLANISKPDAMNSYRVNFYKEHPDFSPYNLEEGNDIALLQLQKPLKIEKRVIELACLDFDVKDKKLENLLFTGFGVTNEKNQNASGIARYSYFNEQTNDSNNTNVIHAVSINRTEAICDGDLGGPLSITQGGLTKVIGIASYNSGALNETDKDIVYCTSEAYFTRLSSAKSFIEKTIGTGHC